MLDSAEDCSHMLSCVLLQTTVSELRNSHHQALDLNLLRILSTNESYVFCVSDHVNMTDAWVMVKMDQTLAISCKCLAE